MKGRSIPDPVVKRLSLYLRQFERLAETGAERVSSRQLGDSLGINAAQIRKDLACFGQFGRPGLGYEVATLIWEIRHILGTDKTWNVVVVGAGNLGRALLRYKGFRRKGFRAVAAFDVSASKVEKKIGPVRVYHLDALERIIRRHNVKLAVLTVPAEAAQEVADRLCRAGVMGIVNFAPTTLETPQGVAVGPVDLAASLEELSFRVEHPR